ncbi:MAG: type IX secretion system membrane protein PorP/SprF [Bacteroidetes bacterium]|nr:type IX secretion system membrane protein PorP/SprF [Bacteroidota bacterium]
MKFIFYILTFTFCILHLFSFVCAQQLPLYTQYSLNDYLHNPAIAGSRDYADLKLNGRYQWAGFTGAPQTVILSCNTPWKSENVGVGGVLYNDRTGPTSRTGVGGSYAYHLRITESAKLSMGLALGIMQYRIDYSKLTWADEGEPGISASIESSMVPDGSFGFYWYAPDYFVGLSSYHIFHNRLKDRVFDPQYSYGYLVNHFFIMGGYKYRANEKTDIVPVLLLKSVKPVPVQVDFSVRSIYEDKYWLGVSFRTQDAFSLLAGININDKFSFGYSYDITISGLKKYSSGSHEVMMSYRFNAPKRVENTEEETNDPFSPLF